MKFSRILSAHLVRFWIPPRKPDSHKGNYGHVLVLAGSKGMSGAGVLSAWGALRGGAGLVTLGVPSSQQPVVARRVRPEAMTLALPETRAGGFSPAAVPVILELVRKRRITSLVVGPGLSRHPDTARFVRKLLEGLSLNLGKIRGIVLDADGFLALKPGSVRDNFWKRSPLPLIATPHPGEMARFAGTPAPEPFRARMESAKKFAKLYRWVLVLKGRRTIVTDGEIAFENSTGNPGMATGGSGDVLSGLVAALLGNVAPGRGALLRAAAAGVYIHGLAGDLAARSKTQIGLTAGDLAEFLPAAFKHLKIQ